MRELRFLTVTITSFFILAQLSLAAELTREKIAFAYAAISPSMAGVRGGSSEAHYEFVGRYLDSIPRVDPAAVDTVLDMVGAKGAAKAKLFDNSMVDRLVQEGFIDKLYKGAKP